MPKPLVTARTASRIYRAGAAAVAAVQDVTCAVMPGQRIALVGPSGSGKSTLLHLLGGLDSPSTGNVEWPGLGARTQLRPAKVVDVFQGPSLLDPLSVIENVKLPLVLIGMPDDTAGRRAAEMLERFDVADLASKLPEEISGGQAQRVSIARAFAVRPMLVLADEPTGQLDVATARSVFDAMLSLAAETNAAMIVSTHDQRVAMRLDETWVLRDGLLDTGDQSRLHAVAVATALTEAISR